MKEGQPIRFENENGEFTISETPTGEQKIFMLPKGPVMKPNQVRHAENLAMLTGFAHGRFYERGIPRLPKEHKRR